ncbi:MAG: choice-of-anchor L domain-containing protein [Clostridia bacterium]|nr:choice-of-anchor L domain-containing protein [Clostridia bacterium]
MNFTKKLLAKSSCVLIASGIFGNAVAQSYPTVKVTSDSQELMNSLFSEPIKAENVKITGNPNQIGVFGGAKNLLDMEDGIVLSTGFASEIFKVQGKSRPEYYGRLEQARSPEPEEDLPDITGMEDDYMFDDDGPTDDQKTEDKDIERETGNKHSYDSVSLEFDVVPTSDKIKLRYVYASNEWQRVFNQYPPEASDDDIPTASLLGEPLEQYPAPDDTAVVIVNGENAAKIPSTGAVLSAKNILEASGYDTSKPGPQPEEGRFGTQGLFIDSMNNHDFGFLGRTKLMEAEASVVPNETNHIKIAVADLEDPFFNTAIFIKLTAEESIENPKTGDIDIYSAIYSTLASATGLAVLFNKSRRK